MTHDMMYARQGNQEEQLKEILCQLEAINRAVSTFKDALYRPRSPPDYE